MSYSVALPDPSFDQERYMGHHEAADVEAEYQFRDLSADLGAEAPARLHVGPGRASNAAKKHAEQLEASLQLLARPTRVSLARFADIRKNNLFHEGLSLLRRPCVVDPSGSIYEDNDDASLDFDEPTHALDAFSVVCKSRGFRGLMPAVSASIEFEATMHPRRGAKYMRDRLTHCGFDLDQRVFHFGRSAGRDLWLLLRPRNPEHEERRRFSHGGKGGKDTPLTPDCRHAFLLFLAECLIKADPRAALHVYHKKFTEASGWSITDCTNILDYENIPFSLTKFRRFDELLVSKYDRWVTELPQTCPRTIAIWEFFSASEPVGMSNQYGQNRPAFQTDVARQEALATEFDRMNNWKHIRYVSCAIATTFRARYRPDIKTEIVSDLDPELGPYFLKPPPGRQKMQQLHDHQLPALKEKPKLPVYVRSETDPSRFVRVNRSVRTYHGTRRGSTGILVDLRKARVAFGDGNYLEADDMGDEDEYDAALQDEVMRGHGGGQPRYPSEAPLNNQRHVHPRHQQPDGRRPTKPRSFSPFSLGFMRHVGNIQTNSPLPYLREELVTINEEVTDPGAEDAITNDHSQIYGEHWHLENDIDKSHNLSRGYVTAALTGINFPPSSPHGKKCCTTLRRLQEKGLPHAVLAHNLETVGENCGLRVEPTIVIDLDRLEPSLRNGRSIYIDILCRIANSWLTPEHTASIHDLMVIFKPEVFPNCLLDVTYPLQCGLDAIWCSTVVKQARTAMLNHEPVAKRIPVRWTIGETGSIFERLLLWATTGDDRVLPTTALRQLGVMQALNETTWPMFSAALELPSSAGSAPEIKVHNFPRSADMTVLSSASASIVFRYGLMASEAFRAEATVDIILADTTAAHTLAISTRLVAHTLQRELVALVHDEVLVKLRAAESEQAARPFDLARTQNRLSALATWIDPKQTENPFNFSDHPFTFVGSNADGYGTRLPFCTPTSMPIAHFVQVLVSVARLDSSSDSVHGAQYLSGSCPAFTRVAQTVFTKLCLSLPSEGNSVTNATENFGRALGHQINELGIRVIPWLKVANWQHPGPGKHRITAYSWLKIAPASSDAPNVSQLPPGEQDTVHSAAANAREKKRSRGAPWSLADCGAAKHVLTYIWDRDVLPEELLPPNLLQADKWSPACLEIYRLLDMSNPAHKYLIWIAVITSQSCPHLTVLTPQSNPVDKKMWTDAVQRYTEPEQLLSWLVSLDFKESDRGANNKSKGRVSPKSIIQCIVMHYLCLSGEGEALQKAAGIKPDWSSEKGQFDLKKKLAAKGIKPLLACRVGIASSSKPQSLPYSPKPDAFGYLPSKDLADKLTDAEQVMAKDEQDGFRKMVVKIWGRTFWNRLVSLGRDRALNLSE